MFIIKNGRIVSLSSHSESVLSISVSFGRSYLYHRGTVSNGYSYNLGIFLGFKGILGYNK